MQVPFLSCPGFLLYGDVVIGTHDFLKDFQILLDSSPKKALPFAFRTGSNLPEKPRMFMQKLIRPSENPKCHKSGNMCGFPIAGPFLCHAAPLSRTHSLHKPSGSAPTRILVLDPLEFSFLNKLVPFLALVS